MSTPAPALPPRRSAFAALQEIGKARGRQGSPRGKVTMPLGWLDDRDGRNLDLSAAEQDASGG